MRQITVRYEGQCRKCNADLPVGASAIYERRVGLFCLSCEPKETEEIRAYRQEGADRKADRYQEWADKRIETASATLNHIQEHYRGDFAFNTQPGHIPERARVIRREDAAYESLRVAERLERKANSLRYVRVAGDAERKRQLQRDFIKARLTLGCRVQDGCFGPGTVKRINQKTATIQFDSGGCYPRDLSYLYVEKVVQS